MAVEELYNTQNKGMEDFGVGTKLTVDKQYVNATKYFFRYVEWH